MNLSLRPFLALTSVITTLGFASGVLAQDAPPTNPTLPGAHENLAPPAPNTPSNTDAMNAVKVESSNAETQQKHPNRKKKGPKKQRLGSLKYKVKKAKKQHKKTKKHSR
jgi:hypothetical protein